MKRRRIFLIRHGETPSNAKRVFQIPETPLSDRGRLQAAALAERLGGEPIERVIASDYERAAHTGRLVAGAAGVELELEPLLRERNFGDLRGRAYADVDGDPFRDGYAPPGGESWADFHGRADRAWSELVDRLAGATGDVALVTHGLVCRAFVDRCFEAGDWLHAAPPGGLAFANTSVTIVGAEAPFAVERVGCVEHLEAAGLAPASRDAALA